MPECPKCKSSNIVEMCNDCSFQFIFEDKSLADRTCSLRKILNITQKELANYLNVSYAAIGKWEKGLTKKARPYLMAKIEEMERQIELDEAVEVFLTEKRRGPKF